MSRRDGLLDTDTTARGEQFAMLRRQGIVARARMTFGASDALRETLEAGVRHRHPTYTESQVQLATLRLMLGPELFAAIHPNETIQP